MKFGNISCEYSNMVNLGDSMLVSAVDNIYKYMNIPEEEVVYVNSKEVETYDGEEIVLPLNQIMFCLYRFSPKIYPVFLGVSYIRLELSQEEIEYYHTYAPVGCRDEYTYQLMQTYGIPSYIGGCYTATFTKRSFEPINGKTYIVEPSDELLRNIPPQLLKDAVFRKHMIKLEQHISAKSFAKELYEEYINNASLVITSRLHCALPCMAAGIPVVLARDEYSPRFMWIDRLLPFYDKTRYGSIDWAPKPVEYEQLKKEMLALAADRINSEVLKQKVGNFCKNESPSIKDVNSDGLNKIREFIMQKWRLDDSFTYALWGLTIDSQNIYSLVKNIFPNAKLVNVYDSYKQGKIGEISARPYYKKDCNPDFVFICCGYHTEGIMNDLICSGSGLHSVVGFFLEKLIVPNVVENGT